MTSPISLVEHGDPIIRNLTQRDFQTLTSSYRDNINTLDIGGGRYWIKAKQYVGRIVLPDNTIIIEPKVGQPIFEFLFSIANGIEPFREEETDYMKLHERTIFERMVAYFVESIRKLCRKGIASVYYEIEENLPAIRGRVLIKENVSQNYVLHSRVYCRYDEFGPDNTHNQIIKYTLHTLLRVPLEDKSLHRNIRHLLSFFDRVSFKPISTKSFPKVAYSRLTYHYKPIIAVCKLLLENSSMQLSARGDLLFMSYLVNMDDLFDKFLASILIRKLVGKGFEVVGAEIKHHFPVEVEGSKHITPDIVIKKQGKVVLVVDAKYEEKVTNGDLYQMWAYCTALNLNTGVLVHPKGGNADEENHTLLNNNVKTIVTSINIKRATINKLSDECDRFADYIETLLN